MDQWTGELGDHEPPGVPADDMAVLVLRGDLLRRYPRTRVTAEHRPPAGTPVHAPASEVFRGTIAPDITYVALRVAPATLHEGHWYFVLTEPPDEPRFDKTNVQAGTPTPEAPAEYAAALFERPFRLLLKVGQPV